MCGIVGIYHFNNQGQFSENKRTVCEMMNLLSHRGPDDRGIEQGQNWTFGHVRLSVIDLSAMGHQPMTNEDGLLWLIYNGEIYNYLELKNELASKGHVFKSNTDSEVILHAYEEWGKGCVHKFVGMWAFALIDSKKKLLWLSRDRFGIKPLYYYMNNEFIVFASEIKAVRYFLSHHNIPLELNHKSIQTYLNSGLVDGLEDSMIKGIKRFPSAHNFTYNGKGLIKERYWGLQENYDQAQSLPTDKEPQLAGQLSDLLEQSVRLHLRSDVPLGVCLSGGLDSSTIVALSSRYSKPINTFTAFFDEGTEYDETPHADKVNKRFETRPFQSMIKSDDFFDKLNKILWFLDEPTLAMGIFPQWHVMEIASKEVKVVLDGQGGDEIFAGYDFYLPLYMASLFKNSKLDSLQDEVKGMNREYDMEYSLSKLNQAISQASQINLKNNGIFKDDLNELLYQELTYSRLPALLRYEDRLSMAFSIESRVPFLDHRIVEFAFSLPSNLKTHYGWSKYILRKATHNYLPKAITWRKDKKGFPTPFKKWVSGKLRNDIRDILLEHNSGLNNFVSLSNINKLLESHYNSITDYSWVIWRLLSLSIWLKSIEIEAVK